MSRTIGTLLDNGDDEDDEGECWLRLNICVNDRLTRRYDARVGTTRVRAFTQKTLVR